MFDKDKVSRGTKCFSPMTNGYPGGFPIGFLKWVNEMGWVGQNRCYLCSGMVDDKVAVKVDVRREVKPTLLEDARKTSLKKNSFDWVMIDPPYNADIAKRFYGTERFFSSINAFAEEAERICKPGGIILTLSYEVPKRLKNCDLVACWGLYQTISVAHMRCFTVWKKK